MPVVFELATLLLGIALFVWLLRTGERFEALVLLFAMGLGLFIEWLGVSRYHLHYYSEDLLFVLGEHPAGIPLVICVGWALVMFTTRRLAARLVAPWFLIPFVAGLLALTLDLFLDPMLARSVVVPVTADSLSACVNSLTPGAGFGVGVWTWCLPPDGIEQLFGVPLANYLGWFLVVAGYALVLETTARWYNIAALPFLRQLVTVAAVAVLTAVLIVLALALVHRLYELGIPNLWILIGLSGLGVAGLVVSGTRRRRWGFDITAVALLGLDAVLCWVAYFTGAFVAAPGQVVVLTLAALTLGAVLLALWILVPWPWTAQVVAPPVITPQPLLTNAQIEAARMAADPPADAVIDTLFNSGQVAQANALLTKLLHSHDPNLFAQLPQPLRDFIDTHSQVDASVDTQKVASGQALFAEYSGIFATALVIASLPEAYVMQGAGRVLGRTQRLERPAALKRIAETAQFVLYVASADGLQTPNQDPAVGKGIKAVLRVRLVHAAIRWLIHNATPGPGTGAAPDYDAMTWDTSVNGEPINQIEMAYTLMTFCWVTLRAIRDTGASFTIAQADDYVYMWRLVGHHLGIQSDLMPSTVHEAAGLFDQLKAKYKVSSQNGKTLTEAALWVMTQMMYDKANLGADLNRSVPRILMAEFLDDETRFLLQVPPLTLFEEVVLQPAIKAAFAAHGWIDTHSETGWAQAVKSQVGRFLMRYFFEHPNLVGTDEFEIPDNLNL